MAKVYYTEEQKKEILDAISAKESGIEKGYRMVKEEFEAAGKSVPSINSVYNWIRAAVHVPETEAGAEDAPAETFGPGECRIVRDADADAEYTRNLELVVRLYRTRSENSIDAVCDRLLPDLIDWENEK